MSSDDAWGQIVSLTDFESPPISLTTDKFVIGRAADCELSLAENKLVSGRHCCIQRDENGKVTLTDSSTNGTLLNMTYKITKGKSKDLQHGDEFYVVYKKENPAANVGYVYQDLAELQREEGTQEYSPPALMDATLEDSDCNYISPEKDNKKRKSTDENEPVEPPLKKQKSEEENDKSNQSKDTKDVTSKTASSNDLDSAEKVVVKETNKVCDAADVKKDDSDKTVSKSSSSEASKASKPAVPERDDIEENLQCMICQEIMHDCISLQPCLHSFCAGCYSDWMSRSNECPSCRKKVERINKNHIVNNLIEAYLKEHPAKKRPEEDIKELNDKNKITNDMLYPKDQLRDSSDYSDTDGSDDEPSVPAPPVLHMPPVYIPPVQPAPLFGFGTPVFGVTRAFKTVCRQCPEYKDPLQNTGILGGVKAAVDTVKKLITGGGDENKTADSEEKPGTSDDGPGTGNTDALASTSGESKPTASKDDVKVMPTAPAFVCPVNQNHVLCICCMQPMPDFRAQLLNAPADRRPQQCSMCYRAFCHAYWGCRKADCLGCLNKFKEMNFGRKALVGLILDNQVESEIFRDYIDSKAISVKDVLEECCRQMDAGRYCVAAQGTHRFTSDSAVCYACGINNFKQLAFQYRKNIKKAELPEDVQKRPDCYWGSKCRTQKNKPHHAKNFNHVCDQTRQF